MKTFRIPFGVISATFVLLTAGLSGCVHNERTTNKALPITNVTTTESHTNDNPEAVWNKMKACLKTGNISGALSYFSVASKDGYRETFNVLSKKELKEDVNHMGILKVSSIESDKAQYYFENNIDGTTLTFPVEFVKEDGKWKIMEY